MVRTLVGRGDPVFLCVKGLSAGSETVLLCLKSQKGSVPYSVCSNWLVLWSWVGYLRQPSNQSELLGSEVPYYCGWAVRKGPGKQWECCFSHSCCPLGPWLPTPSLLCPPPQLPLCVFNQC